MPLDVQGAGGGDEARSTNYHLIDTIGEPNIGPSASNNYNLRAGYRQTTSSDVFLSISGSTTVNLGTIVGAGQRTGTGKWTVITDADAGYSLSWRASTAAMVSGSDSIPAFGPSVADTPDSWSVAASSARWGGHLSVTSTDTAAEWGANDGVGSKWLNVATSNRTIVTRTSRTALAGSNEYVNFRAEVGSTAIQPTGTYTVTITMTAVSL